MRQYKLVKKKKDKTATALLLTFAAIITVSGFTLKSAFDKIPSAEGTLTAPPEVSTPIDLPVSKPIPTVDSTENNISQEAVPNQNNTEEPSIFVVPVKGKIIKEHSADMPVYSKTLNQYMTHIGVDIAAPKDSQVKAVAAGTVTKVENDDKLGSLIEITHDNGYISTYANLSGGNLVELGDVVKKGDVIGGVGSSSLFEVMDECHLHFELSDGSEKVDPTAYIKF